METDEMPTLLFSFAGGITLPDPLFLKRVRLTDLRQYTQAAKVEGETRS
jgi:hypothetical protein